MSSIQLYLVTGVSLFCMGLYAAIVCAHLIRKVLAINIMGTGVSLLLVAQAHTTSDVRSDPVPHALVLTGIVVMVGATALALALIRGIHARTGTAYLSDD